MVLLVPDGPDEVAEESAEASMDPSGQPKAQLDDSEASRATQKVDLDLDDAPFLEDEEEEEVELEEAPEAEAPEEEKKEKKELPAIFKNKMFYMAVVIAVLLIVIVYLMFSRPDAPPPPSPPEPEETVEEPLVESEPVITGEILLRLDPFLIEQKDEKGTIRFLEVRLVLNTTDEDLARQFKQETFTVRNALYYYLKNKDLQFLSDEKNADKLKQELLAVVNQYMGFGQFDSLLFEQYLVR